MSDDRSKLASLGWPSMATSMVGTAGITVGFVLSMSFIASLRTKRGIMTISAPWRTPKFITVVMANTWKNGSAASTRSCPSPRSVPQAAL